MSYKATTLAKDFEKFSKLSTVRNLHLHDDVLLLGTASSLILGSLNIFTVKILKSYIKV